MFDRVAGRYDLLNSLMSAGLHHRWRERAADRADAAPRATPRSTSAAGPATSRSSSPRGWPPTATCRLRLLRADARPRAREGGRQGSVRAPASSGPTPQPPLRRRPLRRGHGRLRRPQLRRPRPRARARWPGCCARGAGWSSSSSPSRTRPPFSTFYSLWFDRIAPDPRPHLTADPEAYAYLAESVRTFPSPERLAERMDAPPASSEIRWTILAGGIIAIHSGIAG